LTSPQKRHNVSTVDTSEQTQPYSDSYRHVRTRRTVIRRSYLVYSQGDKVHDICGDPLISITMHARMCRRPSPLSHTPGRGKLRPCPSQQPLRTPVDTTHIAWYNDQEPVDASWLRSDDPECLNTSRQQTQIMVYRPGMRSVVHLVLDLTL
jgi:hypothetical protein